MTVKSPHLRPHPTDPSLMIYEGLQDIFKERKTKMPTDGSRLVEVPEEKRPFIRVIRSNLSTLGSEISDMRIKVRKLYLQLYGPYPEPEDAYPDRNPEEVTPDATALIEHLSILIQSAVQLNVHLNDLIRRTIGDEEDKEEIL